MSESFRSNDRSLALTAVLAVGVVTLWRLAELMIAPPLLSFDEAQYWAWAQTLKLGYYSKPPMVAWAIAATTAVCGEAEGCIKMGSTLAHGGIALLLYAIGAALFDRRVGLWSALLWITMPAVSLSAMMITTDPFLLLCWAAALLALIRAVKGGPAPSRWWLALGVAFGLGLLSKYAMALFMLSALPWLALSPERRRLLRSPGFGMAVAVGLAIYAPNAVWNALNGFVSYKHTRDNANLSGPLFHPDKLLEFIGGQAAVFGPILAVALGLALWAALRKGGDDGNGDGRQRLLAWFTLPVLAIMAVESLLSRANANWTAPAFVAATVMVAAFLARRRPGWLATALVLHLAVAGGLYHLDAVRRLAGLPDSARFDPEKRLKGWDIVGAQVATELAAHPGARLLGDERKVLATLLYYVRPHPFDAIKWNPSGAVRDHFDQTTRLEPGPGAYIYVTEGGLAPQVTARFDHAERLATVSVPIHPDYRREAEIWLVAGFKGYR